MSAPALAEAADRIAAAWPNARDRSGNPHPAQPEDLPAFALSFEVDSAELYALGSNRMEIQGTMTLTVLVPVTDTPAARDGMADAADQAVQVITDDTDLGGTLDLITLQGWDVEFAAGEARAARLEIRFDTSRIGPDIAVTAPPPLT